MELDSTPSNSLRGKRRVPTSHTNQTAATKYRGMPSSLSDPSEHSAPVNDKPLSSACVGDAQKCTMEVRMTFERHAVCFSRRDGLLDILM